MGEGSELNKALKETLDRYSDTVIRVAFSNVKNRVDAEDIAQNVFIKLVEKRPTFKSEEHKKAWLIRVTINLSRNHLKTAWFRKIVPFDENRAGQYTDNYEIENELIHEIMKLPLNYRNVIYLYYYEGYSVEEIANIFAKK